MHLKARWKEASLNSPYYFYIKASEFQLWDLRCHDMLTITKWSVTRNSTQMKVLWYPFHFTSREMLFKIGTSLTEHFATFLNMDMPVGTSQLNLRWSSPFKVRYTLWLDAKTLENLQFLLNSPFSTFCHICGICLIIATMLLLPNHNRIF